MAQQLVAVKAGRAATVRRPGHPQDVQCLFSATAVQRNTIGI